MERIGYDKDDLIKYFLCNGYKLKKNDSIKLNTIKSGQLIKIDVVECQPL